MSQHQSRRLTLASRNRSRVPLWPRRWRPVLEALEPRCAPAVTCSVVGNQLQAVDNANANGDTVLLDHAGSNTLCGISSSNFQSFADNTFSSILIKPGNGNNDTINLERTTTNKPVTVTLGSGINNTVNLSPTAQNLDAIQGPLTVDGQGNTSTLNINDQGSSTAQTYTITATTVARAGSATVVYHGINRLTLNGARGGNSMGNSITVISTALASITTVNAGAGVGANTITVGTGGPPPAASTVDGLLGDLIVNGQNVLSSLTVNDQTHAALQTYTVDATTVTRAGLSGRVIYSTLRTLTTNGNGGFTVPSTAANILTTINAAPGAVRCDATTVYGVCVGNSLDGVQEVRGTLILDTLKDQLELRVTDAADLQSKTATVTATAVTGLAPAAITYAVDALHRLTVHGGGTGGNIFNLQSTSANTVVTLQTGPGENAVNVGSATNTLNDIHGPVIVDGNDIISPTTFIDHAAGFGSHADLAANNGASFPNGAAQLTDGGVNEARSIFRTTPVDITAFQTTFFFQAHGVAGQADGMTFTVQNDPRGPAAVGDGCQSLGYGGPILACGGFPAIQKSVAVLFDFNNNDTHVSRTGRGQDGSLTYYAPNVANINFASNHLIGVDIGYDGSTLTVVIQDTVTGQEDIRTYAVNIPSVVGANQAYVGFTGGTGSFNETAVQDIQSWTYLASRQAIGLDALNINDQGTSSPPGNATTPGYTITGASMTRAAIPNNGPFIAYSGIQRLTLNGGSGGNSMAVISTAVAATTVVNAGPGPTKNTILVGTFNTVSPPPFDIRTIDGLFGDLIVNGQNALSELTVSDQTHTALQTYSVDATTVARLGLSGRLTYSTLRTLTINGDGGFAVQSTTGTVITTINAGTGALVYVGNALDGVQEVKGVLYVNGAVDLKVDDRPDLQSKTASLTAGTLNGLAGAAINYALGAGHTLTISAGDGGNTFTVTNTAAGALTILNSGGGGDTTTVRQTTGALTVNAALGLDPVNVGSVDNTLDGILGALTVNGGPGTTVLTINDQGTTDPQAYGVTATTITRGARTIAYHGINRLTVNAGNGGDINLTPQVITVAGTGADTTVNTGTGDNLITVNGAGLTRDLHVNGQGGADTLTINDLTNILGALAITSISVAGGSGLTVSYARMENLFINGGLGEAMQVESTASGTTTTLTSTGPVLVTGILTKAGRVEDVRGRLVVVGDGTIPLVVDDSADPENKTMLMVSAVGITGLANAPINYAGLATLTINCGGTGFAGGNTITVLNTAVGTPTMLSLGYGDDTVAVRATNPVGTGLTALTIGLHVTSVGIYTITIGNAVNGIGDINGPILIGAPIPGQVSPLVRLTVDDTGNKVAGRNFALGVAGGIGTISDPVAGSFMPISYIEAIADTVTVKGGGATGSSNMFTVSNTAANPNLMDPQKTQTTIDTGNFGDTVNVTGTASKGPLTINGGKGDDTIKVGKTEGNAQGLSGIYTVNVKGGAGNNKLIVADQGSMQMATYTLSTMPNKVAVSTATDLTLTYEKIQNLVLNCSNANNDQIKGAIPDETSLTINNAQNVTLANNFAAKKAPTIKNVAGTDPMVVVDGVDGLAGGLIIENGALVDLVINDSSTDNQIYTVTANSVQRTGIGSITWDALQSLKLTTGSGDDVVNVAGTPAPTTIQGEAGGDTFNVGNAAGTLNGIVYHLTLTGGSGSDVLNINDQGNLAAQTYQLAGQRSANTVTVTVSLNGVSLIQYTGTQGPTGLTLNSSSGGSTINVLSVVAGTPVTVHTGPVANTINVGNLANQLIDIQDTLTITDAGNNDTLNINDQGTPATVTYILTITDVTATDFPAVINYGSVAYLTLNGTNTGGDTFDVASAGYATTTTINDSGGGNTATVGAGNLDFVGGHVNITFGGANNTLFLEDQNGPGVGYTLGTDATGTRGTFSRSNAGLLLTYAGIQMVTLDAAGSNGVDIQDTLPGIVLSVQIGPINGGSNGFEIQNTGANSQVTITAGNSNSISIEDTGTNSQVIITVGTGNIMNIATTGVGSQVLISAGASNSVTIENTGAGSSLEIDTSGQSTFVVVATGGPVALLSAGIGASSLAGPAGGLTWEILATDTGTITGGNLGDVLSFSGIQTLYGGPGGDTFKFDLGATISGGIIGQGPDIGNTLDFSAWGMLDGIPSSPPDHSNGVIGLPPEPDQQLVVYYDIYNFSDNIIFPSTGGMDRTNGVFANALAIGLAAQAGVPVATNSSGLHMDDGLRGPRPNTVARTPRASDSFREHERPPSFGLADADNLPAHAHRDGFFQLAGDHWRDLISDSIARVDEGSG